VTEHPKVGSVWARSYPGAPEHGREFRVTGVFAREGATYVETEQLDNGAVSRDLVSNALAYAEPVVEDPQAPPAPVHSVSVAGVVVREDGRVLVIRRADNGRWEPPGGVLERGESIEDGVVREVYEETGIKVRVERLSGVYKNMAVKVVALVFRCRPEGGRERLSDESTEVAWLGPDEVVTAMSEAYSVRITDALNGELAPMIRTHDGYELL
jgi:ADP-ribose pyrophosphatase YjhB (NUDIX family)